MIGWYWAEVKGNLLAVVPCGFAAWLWLRSKHIALKEAHVKHSQKLEQLLDLLDPETDTGPSEQLGRIEDRLDTETPGGLEAILKEIRK